MFKIFCQTQTYLSSKQEKYWLSCTAGFARFCGKSNFHAKYSDKAGIFSIPALKMLEGNLPPKVVSLVIEWAEMHKNELMTDWELAQKGSPLKKIEPLV